MKYNTHHKIADAIFENISRDTMNFVDLRHHLAEPDTQLEGIITMMKNDGYITTSNDYYTVKITSKGIDFWDEGDGGYKKQLQDAEELKIMEDANKWYNTENAKRQYEDYPKTKYYAIAAIIISIVSIIVNIIISINKAK